MPSSPTARLRLERQAFGENADSWGDHLNAALDRVDEAIAGATVVNTTGGVTALVASDFAEDESRKAILLIAGALTADAVIEIPPITKLYAVSNGTSGPFSVTIKTAAGTGASIPQETQAFVLCDGATCFLVGVVGTTAVNDNAIPRFDGADGNRLQGSGVMIDDADHIRGAKSLGLRDTDDSHVLRLAVGANLSADRMLELLRVHPGSNRFLTELSHHQSD